MRLWVILQPNDPLPYSGLVWRERANAQRYLNALNADSLNLRVESIYTMD